MPFVNFDSALFLRDYWQKKPLLIRNPWADWTNPVDPDELAGVACEPGVESRLILQQGDDRALEHGPFDEARFGAIGQAGWTLLVQAVDHHVPAVAALMAPFRFMPNWRIDDVMVSYATDGGGVGPHFDQYDVFLVQGLGRRRWRIGAACDRTSALLPHDDLRLLAEFEATDEWVLEPGDILYVPPRFAHDGVAVGDDCMTYSIGFRAPSRHELLGHWADDLLAAMPDDDRYTDPDAQVAGNPGEITPAAIGRLHGMVTQALGDRDAFTRWFGEYSSTPKYPDIDWRPEDPVAVADLRDWLAHGMPVSRNPASRFSFVRQSGEEVLLFVDGRSYACSGAMATLAQMLCGQERFALAPDLVGSDAAMTLLADLFNQGSVALDDDGED